MKLCVGDIVIYDLVDSHHVVAKLPELWEDNFYGLLNLSDGEWSSVTRGLESLQYKIMNVSHPPRISSGNSWTLTEDGA